MLENSFCVHFSNKAFRCSWSWILKYFGEHVGSIDMFNSIVWCSNDKYVVFCGFFVFLFSSVSFLAMEVSVFFRLRTLNVPLKYFPSLLYHASVFFLISLKTIPTLLISKNEKLKSTIFSGNFGVEINGMLIAESFTFVLYRLQYWLCIQLTQTSLHIYSKDHNENTSWGYKEHIFVHCKRACPFYTV